MAQDEDYSLEGAISSPIADFALVFLHRELQKVDQIVLSPADFQAWEEAASDKRSGGRFFLADDGVSVILRPIKARDDA